MTFGNNDCKYHFNAPPESDSLEFYSYIFDLWFNKHIPNRKYAEQVKETFLNGGYYRVDIDKNLSILSVNTLPYNTHAVPELIYKSSED